MFSFEELRRGVTASSDGESMADSNYSATVQVDCRRVELTAVAVEA